VSLCWISEGVNRLFEVLSTPYDLVWVRVDTGTTSLAPELTCCASARTAVTKEEFTNGLVRCFLRTCTAESRDVTAVYRIWRVGHVVTCSCVETAPSYSRRMLEISTLRMGVTRAFKPCTALLWELKCRYACIILALRLHALSCFSQQREKGAGTSYLRVPSQTTTDRAWLVPMPRRNFIEMRWKMRSQTPRACIGLFTATQMTGKEHLITY